MNMDISKRVCCTCLSNDRKLFKLCRTPDGVNILYTLLMCDSDAYREGFFKDTASWMVCWECRAIIKKIMQFRSQICTALKQLKEINNGRINQIQTLSHLSIYNKPATTIEMIFIDCGNPRIKAENIAIEDDNVDSDTQTAIETIKKHKNKSKTKNNSFKKFYKVSVMEKEDFEKVMNKRKLDINDEFKCESCVLGFKDESALNLHNSELHTKKEKHTFCEVCLSYIKDEAINTHTNNHYNRYTCVLCQSTVYSLETILKHIEEIHGRDVGKKKKRNIKTSSPMKYPCSECDMIFENKGGKWKHVQKCHRAGHACHTCQKIFTFKHNLQRHQLTHTGPQPRTECPQCHKQVLTSLLTTHARTHVERTRVACVPCGKLFVCRATYENHLKYAQAHAGEDSLRHPCTSCEKKFRSRGELRDHIAYRHEERATYKCPVCDKSLATRRCVTRHVRRAHDGIKERARDKMCDYCGKAFRDKQSLAEHVSRHTGARPLVCGRCHRTFRQRAALHAHMRRLHPT